MKKQAKRKVKAQGVNQVQRRPNTRQQSKAGALRSPPADENESNFSYVARRCVSKSKAPRKFTPKKIETSPSQSIPTAEDTSRHPLSEQHSTSHVSRDYMAAFRDLSMPSPSRNTCNMVPGTEVDVAPAADAFASNTSPSNQVAVEVARVGTKVVENQTGDKFNNFYQKRKNKFNNKLPVPSPDLNVANGVAFAGNSSSSEQGAVGVAGEQADFVEDLNRERCDESQPMDENLGQSSHFGLTEYIGMFRDDASSEKVKSSFSLVSVGGYNVKAAAAPMLRKILKKHGDIASDCTMTVAGRSSYLETICDIMLNLQGTLLVDMKDSDIKRLIDRVEELGEDKLRVSWLLNRLKEILEAKKLADICIKLRKTRAAKSAYIQESKKEVERCDLVIKEEMKKIAEYDAKKLESKTVIQAFEKKKCLEQENQKNAEAELENIRERVSSSRPKVEVFLGTSVMHDLI